jgi:DNA polymerase/3'-5' exonuclease PolX
MSDAKKRWPHAEALAVAKVLKCTLSPVCLLDPEGKPLIKIAGSLRRWKQTVGDIEIVFVSQTKLVPDGLFEQKEVNLASVMIESMLTAGIIVKRLAVTGRISSWGDDNKHAIHVASGIPVDFFCEKDSRDWPRTLAIRTGPRDFNIRLMATAPKNGFNAHAYGEALHKCGSGERVFADTERHFIELCGIKYVEPKYRT